MNDFMVGNALHLADYCSIEISMKATFAYEERETRSP